MTVYQIRIVDAFTSKRYAGNPCAVVTKAEGLSKSQMQSIAREMNLSETAFVTPSKVADFRVRFFTPNMEIPLAGHPTIATMFTLADEGRIDLSSGPKRVTQQLNVGVLPVDLSRAKDGSTRVVMTQAKPEFRNELDKGALAKALGLEMSDICTDVPAQVVSTGTPQAMLPVVSLDVLRKITTDIQLLRELEGSGGYFSLHVFALEAMKKPHRAHSRHFAAGAGIAEDPVTGSASGGMAAYLWKHGLVREATYTVEQGHIMGRPGIVELQVDAYGDEPEVVRIAGTAVTVLTGTITV